MTGRAASMADYIEEPADQITADLVRFCRAQGVWPRDILQALSLGALSEELLQKRHTVLRGLARRGWDAQELAEVFPLSVEVIRDLVRRVKRE